MQTENGSNRVAVISIIVEEPQRVAEINEILHSASEYIIGRMGIPYREKNISIISIVIDAPMEAISSVSGRLGRLSGVTAKTAYSKS
ncbi:MAG: iron-only hydrogenase system regulator [Ruminococcus sp.]|nr:iron-only hydrogenase system regulator [Ruminococcus sp.]